MSFILDALRKSDSQRQQQAGPGLATAQQKLDRSRRNVWAPLLVLVLALNAALVAWIFLPDRDAAPAVSDVPAPVSDDTARIRVETRPLREEARTAPAASVAPAPALVDGSSGEPTTSDVPPVVDVTPVIPVAVEDQPRQPGSVAAANAGPVRDALPTFEQLLVGGIIATPQLHLDIHVFSGEPDKRFVFINMSKYREGQPLKEGPVVEEITETGVILSHQGSRFTLDRN